ncbi:uncharacterized protein LOC141649873 [Silene latifolia]|uniref:uncharacterized protein LOC141649873 n=1 Tax=Silene latifolia TaxID=37657 RepID=UPI003D77361E
MAKVNRKELHGNKKFRNGSSDTPITPSSCTAAGSSSSSRPSCTSQKEPDPVTRLVNELIRDLSPTNESSSSWVNPQEGTSSRPSCSGQQALDPVARLVSDLVRNLSEEYDDPSSREANEEDLELEGDWDIGDPDVSCNKYGAILWYLERVRKDRNTLHPTFSLCCSDGKITLPLLKQPPQLLLDLLSRRHPLRNHFIDNIRAYNMMFLFTSMGGKIDNSVNQGRGPYTFRMGGQNVHRIGSLLPPDQNTPKFCQLYIYDTEQEVQNRKNAHRTYNRPTASEVAVLIEGDIGNAVERRDIIIEKESGELQRISGLIRVETYKNITNAVDRGETEPSSAGSRIFMSSSVLQSDGYTIEIMRFVSKRVLRPEDRPDILSRVFKMKLAELMKDLKDRHIFGRVIGDTYTIEFQKRGLPHAHILICLHRDVKFPEAANVDKIISAEIPDPDENPLLYALVKENMIYGLCGKDFPTCPCMVASKCSRNFPKRCIESTTVDGDGYPVYKRREKGFTVVKSGRKLGNEWVVPYNAQLLLKYRAHINVEWSCEAVWRIFGFEIHYKTPPVERLRFHLPDEQSVVFNDEDPIDSIIDNPTIGMTKFLAWMDCNKSSEEAQQLLYSQFPTKFMWKQE